MREVKLMVDEHGTLYALDCLYIKKLLVDVPGIQYFGRVMINNKNQAPKECPNCGGVLSKTRYHYGKPYRHCFSCHFEFYAKGETE